MDVERSYTEETVMEVYGGSKEEEQALVEMLNKNNVSWIDFCFAVRSTGIPPVLHPSWPAALYLPPSALLYCIYSFFLLLEASF